MLDLKQDTLKKVCALIKQQIEKIDEPIQQIQKLTTRLTEPYQPINEE